MDLASSLSGTKEFRIVKRGYDPDEVDAFLDQIAMGVAELKRKLAEARDQAAAAPPATAAPEGGPGPATDEIQRALILAQRAADDEVRQATEKGEALVAEARERADALVRDAEREVTARREEGRAALLVEISELESTREALGNDIVVLERHVEEQREVVQAAVGELQSLLDHPEAFRVAPAAEVSSVTLPEGGASPAADGPEAAASDDDDEESDRGRAASSAPPPSEGGERLPGLDELTAALATDPEPAAPPSPSPPPPPEVDDDGGPPTQALDAVDDPDGPDQEEDAFLAELRKAMLDDEPLGPRDESRRPSAAVPDEFGRGRSRFGRRR